MPIPDGEVTLDGEALKTEGREEKTTIIRGVKRVFRIGFFDRKIKGRS